MLRILDITGPDILQGWGTRCSLWVSGCKHHCPLCQNQWTWKYEQGRIYNEEKKQILKEISNFLSKEYYQGITFSGGDPLYQDNDGLCEIFEIIQFVRKEFPTKDIWLYTGFTMEEIEKSNNYMMQKIVDNIDYLVDGQFKNELKDISLRFRGSSNQIIWQKDSKSGKFVKSELN